MKKHNQLSKRNVGLIGAICSSLLIGLPLSPLPGVAKPLAQNNQNTCTCPQTPVNRVSTPGRDFTLNRIVPGDAPTTAATVLNPRPSIFKEPPYNRVGTSATAPMNPPGTARTLPVQPPLPEQRSQAIAMVMPTGGQVAVRLKNNTNVTVTYEAIGHTGRRLLPGGEEVVLRNLPTPVSVTMIRQDKGLLDVIPTSTSEQGLLEVSLDEAKNLDDNQGVLRIQRDGQVFLN